VCDIATLQCLANVGVLGLNNNLHLRLETLLVLSSSCYAQIFSTKLKGSRQARENIIWFSIADDIRTHKDAKMIRLLALDPYRR